MWSHSELWLLYVRHVLSFLALPTPTPHPTSSLLLRTHCTPSLGVWEGQFVVPGSGAFLLTADALAGSGDLAALLGDREVRGGG